MRRSALCLVFFLSGLAGLTYELAWQRLLHLVFGVSTLSVSVVLAAFMGGLALGGVIFGRLSDRTSRPLACYGLVEFGIALSGLLVPIGLQWVGMADVTLHALFAPAPWTAACLRFVLALMVLLVPSTLIGGTVPLMARLLVRPTDGLPRTFSLLYAANTLGAVLGASAAGFLLLRVLGTRETLWITAALNLVIGIGAGVASLRGVEAHSQASAPEPAPAQPSAIPCATWAFVSAAGMGLAGMGYEVVWMRVLGILTSNSAYGFALMLTVLLLGLALGSWVQAAWSSRGGNAWQRLALCQWCLAGAVSITLPLLHTAPGWFERRCEDGSVWGIFIGETFLTAALVFVPALLMGLSLPLLVTGITHRSEHFGKAVGRLYAWNTCGAVVGATLTGLCLIRCVGIHQTAMALSGCTLAVGVVAWLRAGGTPVFRLMTAAAVVITASAAWLGAPVPQYMKSAVTEPRRLLFYQEGDNATVSVVAEANGTRALMVDGQPVAGTSASSMVDQKMLAHLPLLLHPDPKRALTVGFGSGGTSYSMGLHGVDVDCVEIEGAVAAAAARFESQNHGVLTHSNFRLLIDDARNWLRIAQVHYDVIVTDCTNIQYRSNGDLYTTDYFQRMHDRLTPGGVAAAWLPANGIHEADLKTLLRSFHAVFPHTSVWFMDSLPTDFLIVVGTPETLHLDLEQMAQRMSRTGVREDLAAVGFSDPARLAFTFLLGDAELSGYLGDGPLNTDDLPILSYSTYGASFLPTAPVNLMHMLACRGDVSRYISHGGPSKELLRHYAASNDLMLGHIASLVGASTTALTYYIQGAQLLPGDVGLQQLVGAASRPLR